MKLKTYLIYLLIFVFGSPYKNYCQSLTKRGFFGNVDVPIGNGSTDRRTVDFIKLIKEFKGTVKTLQMSFTKIDTITGELIILNPENPQTFQFTKNTKYYQNGVQVPSWKNLINEKSAVVYFNDGIALSVFNGAHILKLIKPDYNVLTYYFNDLTGDLFQLPISNVKEIQELLNKNGHSLGTPDGKIGFKTSKALEDYQLKTGIISDYDFDGIILSRLKNKQ